MPDKTEQFAPDGIAAAFRERGIALPSGTMSRESFIARNDALVEEDAARERINELQRRARRGILWRRALIVVLLLLFAGEVWRQAQ